MSDSISVTIEYEKVEVTILGPDFIQVNLLEPTVLGTVPTAQNIGDVFAAADSKPTPANADLIGYSDSEDGDIIKSMTFANAWTWIRGLADLVYQPLSTALSKITEAGGLPLWDGGDWPGGGGGEWTEVTRQTISSAVSAVTFLNCFTDDYARYRARFVAVGGFSATPNVTCRVGYGVGPTWMAAAAYHLDESSSISSTYTGSSSGAVPGIKLTRAANSNRKYSGELFWDNLRIAANYKSMRGVGVLYGPSFVFNCAVVARVNDAVNKFDHLEVYPSAGTFSLGTIIVEGAAE